MLDATLARPFPFDDLTLFVETFLLRWEGTNTQAAYRQDLTTFFRWCSDYGLHPITDVKRPHLELYLRWMLDDRGYAKSTAARRLGTLSLMYEIAIDDDLIARNPARLVRRPKITVDQNERVALAREEMQRLARAAYDSCPSDYALTVLMANLGLRVSEACALDVADCLYVSKAHRCLRFVGKGDKPAIIPQPPVVMRAVDAAISDRVSGPLLLRRDGSRQTRRSADRVVKRCAKAAGIQQNVSPHTLRHTFIVAAIDAGVPIRQVQIAARQRRHLDHDSDLRQRPCGPRHTRRTCGSGVLGCSGVMLRVTPNLQATVYSRSCSCWLRAGRDVIHPDPRETTQWSPATSSSRPSEASVPASSAWTRAVAPSPAPRIRSSSRA